MMMDTFGGCHSTVHVAAIKPYEEAVLAVLAHRAGAAEALSEALTLEPQLVGAHALRGFGLMILARAELAPAAKTACVAACTALTQSPRPTRGENALVLALKLACDGSFSAAAERLEAHLATHPQDLLILKLVQALRFMVGDLPGMLRATELVLPAWDDAREGAGFVYGCHAFALEEAGQFDEAERLGRHGLMLEPRDAWGLHAVSHVHEMQGRLKEGVHWLEATRRTWSRCNNFAFHIAWHLALFHLEHGETERALALYDSEVRPGSTDDFRDISNASSLLWRLQQQGVHVGQRWEELAALAKARAQDTSLVFASLFHIMSALSAGDVTTAEAILAAWTLDGATPNSPQASDQTRIARDIGLPLAHLLVTCFGRGAKPAPSALQNLPQLQQLLPHMGGSHAQRDVFVRTLALMAADCGDPATSARILTLRSRLRVDGRLSDLVQSRLARARAASTIQPKTSSHAA